MDPLWFYEFSGNNNKHNKMICICIQTLKHILSKKNGKVRGVDLNFYTDANIEHHQQLLKASLNEFGVKYTSPYKKGVDIPVCDWRTIFLISRLDMPFEIVVSGGGTGDFTHMSMLRKQSCHGLTPAEQIFQFQS